MKKWTTAFSLIILTITLNNTISIFFGQDANLISAYSFFYLLTD